MYSKLLLLFVALFAFGASSKIYAQSEFLHGLGFGLYYKDQIYKIGTEELRYPLAGYAVIYNPRLIFANLSDNVSLAASAYPAIGFSGNSRSGSSNILDVPVTAELSFGAGASSESEGVFGAYVNAGYGYNLMAGTDVGGGGNHGPIVGGGIRLGLGEKVLGLRGSYMLSTSSSFSGMFSIGAIYYFGFD